MKKYIIPTILSLTLTAGISCAATVLFPYQGGTGISSYSRGDIIYASDSTTLVKLNAGNEGQVLKISGGVPVWGTDEGGVGSGDVSDVGDCSSGACFTANGAGNTLYFEGTTTDDYEIALQGADATADRTITLPDDTGTILLKDQIDTEAEFESLLFSILVPTEALLLNQTTPQTILNDVPLLDTTPTGSSDIKSLVNKEYVDLAVTSLGASYYMYDDNDATGYKTCHLDPSSDAETYIEETDLSDDDYIGGWISGVGEAPSKLLKGVYNWYLTLQKPSGTKTLRVYWKLIERKSNDDEVVIATSSNSNEINGKAAYLVPLQLNEDYIPDSGSRIVGKLYADVSDGGSAPTIRVYYQGTTSSRWEIPANTEIFKTIFVPYDGAVKNVDLGSYDLTTTGTIDGGAVKVNGTDVLTSESDPDFAAMDTEAELESHLTDVSDVFTNNDGSLDDDDLSDNSINDLSDVNTTGWATGKVLKFDASGNLVVGDDEGSSYTAGTGLDLTGTTFSLSHLGLESLTDPDANRLLYWNDNSNATAWLDYSGWDTDVSDDFSGSWNDLTDIPAGFADNTDDVDDSVSASELNADYGDFTCNGTTCTLDTDYLPLSGGTLTGTHTYNGAVIDLDGGASEGTLRLPNSTTLPATCSVGDVYWDTDADTDGSLYVCKASNTWKEVDDDGGGGSGDISDVGDCSTGACFTADGAGNSLYFEGSTPDGNEIILTAADPNADYTITLPAETGTVCTTGSVCSGYQASITAGRSLTFTGNTLDVDAEAYTDTKCIWIENPTAADDLKSLWRAKQAATVTSIWCESDQTVVAMLQVDDGTPADMDSVDLTCDSTPAEDTSLNGDNTLAAGDRIDLDITSVSGSPTWVSICFTLSYDD